MNITLVIPLESGQAPAIVKVPREAELASILQTFPTSIVIEELQPAEGDVNAQLQEHAQDAIALQELRQALSDWSLTLEQEQDRASAPLAVVK